MQLIEQLLQVSANLYKHLGDIPKSEERDDFIDTINSMLDKRGSIIERLLQEEFTFESQNLMHRTLSELDNGINERLATVMNAVKQDIANLQKQRKVRNNTSIPMQMSVLWTECIMIKRNN